MTKKYIFIVFTIVVLLFLGLILRRWQILLPILPLLFYLIIPETELNLEVERWVLQEKIREGEELEVKVLIKNKGKKIDILSGLDTIPEGSVIVKGKNYFTICLKNEFCLKYSVILPRGICKIGPLILTSQNFLKTSKKKKILENSSTVKVYPKFKSLRLELKTKYPRIFPGIFKSRRVGQGTEFYSLRDYVFGDELRVINWKATSRFGKLISNEYEGEKSTDFILVLDASEKTSLGDKKILLDFSVEACLSLAFSLLREKNRVGLVILSDIYHYLPPSSGKRQFLKMAELLLSLKPCGKHPFFYLTGYFSRFYSKNLILVSPLLDKEILHATENLYKRGFKILIFSPSPVEVEDMILEESFEKKIAKSILNLERKNFISKLKKYAKVFDWNPKKPMEEVL